MINLESRRRSAERFGEYLRSLRRKRGWISQVAEAYGVEVSELFDASDAADHNDASVVLPIKGYLGAGTTPESAMTSLGTISLPSQMIQGHTDDYCLRVSGDSLAPDGIHDGDVLLVCPDQEPSVGSLCVVDMDFHLCAVTFIDRGNLRVRTATGSVVEVDVSRDQMVGTVAWHVRKM